MNVGVFCASSDPLNSVYYEAARQLGKAIAENSWSLVYGGTNCGMMREVAEAVLQNGGKVKGVIPQRIAEMGIASTRLDDLVVASDMKERKQLLRDYSDAFIALPGGWGTLEEITEVITLKHLGYHGKPIVFLNAGGYYDAFFEFIRKAGEEGFVSRAYAPLYEIVNTPQEALAYIRNYQPQPIKNKYGKIRS